MEDTILGRWIGLVIVAVAIALVVAFSICCRTRHGKHSHKSVEYGTA